MKVPSPNKSFEELVKSMASFSKRVASLLESSSEKFGVGDPVSDSLITILYHSLVD